MFYTPLPAMLVFVCLRCGRHFLQKIMTSKCHKTVVIVKNVKWAFQGVNTVKVFFTSTITEKYE